MGYVGEVKNDLDRLTVVTSIPIPKYVDIDRKPMKFKNCSVENQSSNSVTTEMNEWCAKVVPELKPHVVTKSGQRSHRGLGAILLSVVPGLITLAVESISSYLKGRQQRRIDEAVVLMRRDQQMTYNRLQQYSNDFLMYGKYNVETLTNVINTVSSLHKK